MKKSYTHIIFLCLVFSLPKDALCQDLQLEDLQISYPIKPEELDLNKVSQEERLKEQSQEEEYIPYIRHHHTWGEISGDLAMIYGISWGLYVTTQFYRFDQMSFENMKDNINHVRFWDGDKVFWNFVIHPFSGSQLYLYYRSRAYAPFESFLLTFTSSAFFEFFIETATESPSFNDLLVTPILGSAVGVYLEKIAIQLLNSNKRWQKILGRIIHPSSNFYWFEYKGNRLSGRYEIIPTLGYRVNF